MAVELRDGGDTWDRALDRLARAVRVLCIVVVLYAVVACAAAWKMIF